MTYPNHLGLVRALFILSVWIYHLMCKFEDGAWTDPETSHFAQIKRRLPCPNASCAERQRISTGNALVFRNVNARCGSHSAEYSKSLTPLAGSLL